MKTMMQLARLSLLMASCAMAQEPPSPFQYDPVKRIACSNPSEVILREAHYFGTNEVIYRISMGWSDATGQFVRIGDFIGDFQIVGQSGRRGAEALVLKDPQGREWVLKRAARYVTPNRRLN